MERIFYVKPMDFDLRVNSPQFSQLDDFLIEKINLDFALFERARGYLSMARAALREDKNILAADYYEKCEQLLGGI